MVLLEIQEHERFEEILFLHFYLKESLYFSKVVFRAKVLSCEDLFFEEEEKKKGMVKCFSLR